MECSHSTSKPPATLSLDLDNQWAYLRGHNTPGWQEFPSYLDLVVPRILEFLEEHSLTITFFIVGQDAELDKNRELLRSISDSGHEIANHSFGHDAALHLYSPQQIQDELSRAEACIERATGVRPVGFRGPSFCLSDVTLTELVRRGYQYDATTLPTFIGPLARAYLFMKVNMPREERRKRRRILGGRMSEGLRPLKPYRWQTDEGSLLEIPVTTMPGVRAPIHATYLQWLGQFSNRAARMYFDAGMKLCRVTETAPSVLLHPTDFLGSDDPISSSFLPAMGATREEKLGLLDQVMRKFRSEFEVMPLGHYAERIDELADVPRLKPNFSAGI